MAKASFSVVWARIIAHQGEEFSTITGREFIYWVEQAKFHSSRTEHPVSRKDFEKAYALVPLDGPREINNVVRGPSYVWAVLHDHRISQGEW